MLLFGQYANLTPIIMTTIITEYVMRSVEVVWGGPLLSGVGGKDQFVMIFDLEEDEGDVLGLWQASPGGDTGQRVGAGQAGQNN